MQAEETINKTENRTNENTQFEEEKEKKEKWTELKGPVGGH